MTEGLCWQLATGKNAAPFERQVALAAERFKERTGLVANAIDVDLEADVVPLPGYAIHREPFVLKGHIYLWKEDA